MNKKSTLNAFLAAALSGLLTGGAWSGETATGGAAAQAPATPVPGWYPARGAGAPAWQVGSPWPPPPPGYAPLPPFYGPYGAAASAPKQSPLDARLRQTRKELTAQGEELDAANARLEQFRLRLQESLETERTLKATIEALTGELRTASHALQQAQSGNTLAGQQLDTAMARADTLKNELTGLKVQLENQRSLLMNAVQDRATPPAGEAGAPANRDETTPPPADAGQTLAAVVAERDGLLADMATVVAERDRLQQELAACRRELAGPGEAPGATPSR